MSDTDDRMATALRHVADDTTSTSDDDLWAAIDAEAAGSPPARWRRPVLLVAASVAAVAAVVVGATVIGDDGRDELNVVDDPTTTVETTEPDPGSDPEPSDGTTPSTEPDRSDETTDDEVFVGPGVRPMVVVSQDGGRVTAHFSDGRDPIVYLPHEPVTHAELGPDGTMWITAEAATYSQYTLMNIDPTTGEPLETIDSAGFASISPDGTRLAYAQNDPNAVVIRNLDGSGERELLAQDPDGPTGEQLWTLGHIQWSPDGSRIVVNEFWEDDLVWLVDLETHDHVDDGMALSLGGVDWIDDGRLIGTQYCCYGDPDQEPRHLVEVDLTGDEPAFIDRDETSAPIVAVAPGRLDTAVHVVGDTFDATGTLVQLATGDEIAEGVIAVQW